MVVVHMTIISLIIVKGYLYGMDGGLLHITYASLCPLCILQRHMGPASQLIKNLLIVGMGCLGIASLSGQSLAS